MNYILHLNHWFSLLEKAPMVRPTHISLYVALFNVWNKQRFADPIYVTRSDLMEISKIGSKTTYSQCMTDLHHWGWIYYVPSNSIYAKSEVRMFNWSQKQEDKKADSRTKSETTTWTSTGPVVGHNIQTSTKQNKPFLNQTKQEKNTDAINLNSSFKSKYHEPL